MSVVIPIVYDSANDPLGGEITDAVTAGARYFYDVDDTGGSWYVLLASQEPIDDVQQAWQKFCDDRLPEEE